MSGMANMATAAAAAAAAGRDTQATVHRDMVTDIAAQSVSAARTPPLPLPTPPNSLSPGLPPQGLHAQLLKAKLESNVPDLDLNGSQHKKGDRKVEDTGAPGGVSNKPLQNDAAGAITPAMLSKHHLPIILLNHGPLAIRHIMGYLTTSVPGFAGIPPVKARRLVVGALEGRRSAGDGDGNGPDGEVEFEKVGWGRWEARRRGQSRRGSKAAQDASSPHLSAKPVERGSSCSKERSRVAGSSPEEESVAVSSDDRSLYIHDHDADNMSLDGPASASCSEAPDEMDVETRDDDPEDVTDEEDWAAIGAAGLRAQSYSKSVQPGTHLSRFQNTSSGMLRTPQLHNIDMAALAATSDPQEREAIEALLRLGSV